MTGEPSAWAQDEARRILRREIRGVEHHPLDSDELRVASALDVARSSSPPPPEAARIRAEAFREAAAMVFDVASGPQGEWDAVVALVESLKARADEIERTAPQPAPLLAEEHGFIEVPRCKHGIRLDEDCLNCRKDAAQPSAKVGEAEVEALAEKLWEANRKYWDDLEGVPPEGCDCPENKWSFSKPDEAHHRWNRDSFRAMARAALRATSPQPPRERA